MYTIIVAKLLEIDSNSILQMIFKTLNNSINFDDLIFTLLVFDAYFRIIEMNVSSSTIIQRFISLRKAMNEVRKLNVIRQLNDALNIRNDSFSILIHSLSLNSDVLLYREKNDNQSKSWKNSFKLLNVNNESAIIELDWPQGWVSDMSNSPTRSNPRVGQKFLSDESGRVLAIVRRPNSTREIVRNLRLDKIR
jgi:hypothetical protein